MATLLTLSGKRLSEIRSGLATLKDRRLPATEAECLVASLWQLLAPAFAAYDSVVESIQREAARIKALDEDEQEEAMAELAKRVEALNAFPHEVRAPKTVIGPQHLPKAYKGEMGQMNPLGNAAVIIALSPEFYHDPALAIAHDDAPVDAEEDE